MSGAADATPTAIVVAGASGSGKSTIGSMLAARLHFEFIEGDRLHPARNVERMASGRPLRDEDRLPWLHVVGERLGAARATSPGAVASCSALKRSYRDVLRSHVPDAFFVLLVGDEAVLRARIEARRGGFMPESLLSSQLAILESLGVDERGVSLGVAPAPEAIVAAVERAAGLARS